MGQSYGDLPQEGKGHHLTTTEAAGAGGTLDPDGAADEGGGAFLEAGRLLFAGPWDFTRACHAMEQLPPVGADEVAFAGRSNVGKSSLINALVGQKALARASNTPGRTRALNMFARRDGVGPVVVDMPGYGYAKAPKADVAAWTALVFDYLRGRPNLKRVFLLIDGRHGPKPVDLEAMAALDEAAVSYQAVLTKADKMGREREATHAATAETLRRRPAAHPDVLITSADRGEGIAELRAAIAELAAANTDP